MGCPGFQWGSLSRQGGKSERSQAEATGNPPHAPHKTHTQSTAQEHEWIQRKDLDVIPLGSQRNRAGGAAGACLPGPPGLLHLPGSAWSLESHEAAEHWGSQSWPNPTRSCVCTCCMLNHTCGHTCMHIHPLTCTQLGTHTPHSQSQSHTHTHSQSRTHIQAR